MFSSFFKVFGKILKHIFNKKEDVQVKRLKQIDLKNSLIIIKYEQTEYLVLVNSCGGGLLLNKSSEPNV
jgi:hypothetical protein